MKKNDQLQPSQHIRVLILDDQEMWQETTRINCESIFNEINNDSTSESTNSFVQYFVCDSPEQALKVLSDSTIHILFLDKDLGTSADGRKINGVDLIPKFKAIQPFCQILMLTADTSHNDIAKAMKNGASDYLLKGSSEEYQAHRHEVIKRALAYYLKEVEYTKNETHQVNKTHLKFICSSPAMQRFDNKLIAVSESNRPVLLLGKTGLGKTAAARRINELSAVHFEQNKRPFVQINIGATEKSMIDSLLFGTEPGAYTGASSKTKAGLLDLARNGDIFLDEIGEASLDLQIKLLKVIEEKEYYRVGGNLPIKTNARFIFATNQNLQEMISSGRFREDLYMRISVFEENLPLLKERKSDLPEIIKEFLSAASREFPKKQIRYEDLPEDLIKHLTRDDIPGNIRGIENDICRIVAHATTNELGIPDFKSWKKILGFSGSSLSQSDNFLSYKKIMNAKFEFKENSFPGLWALTQGLERKIFEEIKSQGITANEAAKILKISRNTVLTRMKEFGLSGKETIT